MSAKADDTIKEAEKLLANLSNGGNWQSYRDGNQATNISSQFPFKGEHCGASTVNGLPRAWNPHFCGIDVFSLPSEFNVSRFRDADADFIAAAPGLVRKLIAALKVDCTCRAIEKCDRCEAIDRLT